MAKGKPQKRFTNGQIEAALKQKAGNVTAAATALGCSRSTLYRRMQQSPGLIELVTDERETLVDIAESMLKREVLAGNITAIIFTLKTVGKSRGYVERQEYAGVPDQPVTIKLQYADAPDDDEQ